MKFRIVESNEFDKKLYELIRDNILTLSTEALVKKANLDEESAVIDGYSFILPNGKFVGDIGEMHDDFILYIVSTILEEKLGYTIEFLDNWLYDLVYEHLIENLGWIKANTGTLVSREDRLYFVLPKNRVTSRQYGAIEDTIEFARDNHDYVVVFIGMNGNANKIYTFYKTSGEIVDNIRRLYSSGYFVEEVAEHKDVVNWNVDSFIRKYIIGMSTEEIVDEASLQVTTNSVLGPSFILPNGNSIFVDKNGLANANGMHQDILLDICRKILYKKTNTIPNINRNAITENLYDYLIDTLGWVKMNTGSGASDNRCYVVIPSRKVKMKNAQYYTLEDCLWIAYKDGKRDVQILEGFDNGGAIGRYSFSHYSPKEIIKEIKKFYSGGSFIYECKELHEVYPNKGESKNDFIARFMSVTKDEYPNEKQRYAVALSYWDRRNKNR